MRSGSSTWFSVAGPLAQLRPREPGCAGLPSNFAMRPLSLSTYASSPHAASQLKQIVGMSEKRRFTFRGQATGSYSSQSFQRSTGGKLARPPAGAGSSRAEGCSGSEALMRSSTQGNALAGFDPDVFVDPQPEQHEQRGEDPDRGVTGDEAE